MTPSHPIRRRTVLRSAVAGLGGSLVGAGSTACQAGPDGAAPSQTATRSQGAAPSVDVQGTTGFGGNGGRVLLAYFSRAGENYYYGGRRDLQMGNTEVLAGMISRSISCDVYRIEAADPYPQSYQDTVARNVREQDAGARPAIAKPLPDISQYSTVLLASGIWNSRAPMIMTTFTEGLDFKGKTVHPVTTYAMSGLGSTERDYGSSCLGATVGEGLAVRGEEVEKSGADIQDWLRRNRFPGS